MGVELWRLITVVCYFAKRPAEFDTHWLRNQLVGIVDFTFSRYYRF
ncbi:hypothetical protein FB106_11214 [Synechococcus sp. Ace-Pa]|nr:hypothetical protein FB106_11214 [Synechococcus sp. Ace-Pa]